MFDLDLDELSTADLLSVAAEFAQVREQAEVGVLRAALAFADRHAVVSWQEAGEAPLPGYERLVVYGGEGCPGVAEFAPLEFGAVLGISSGAAASLIGEALALRHRLPRVWAAVLNGDAIAWRARKIAEACLPLSIEAAAIVDRRVAAIVNTVTPYRLNKIVKAAIWHADPARAKAEAEAAARTRGVFVSQSDDHGTKRIWVRAAAGAVIRFDATIDDLARALKAMGDTDSLDQRRAKAIDWIADPAAAHHLIEVARHLAGTAAGAEGPVGAEHAAGTEAEADSASASDRQDPSDAALVNARGATEAPDVELDEDERARLEEAYLSDALGREPRIPADPDPDPADDTDQPTASAELAARLAAIKRDAHRTGLPSRSRARSRHTVYVHLTDLTLSTGTGVLRVEELGPQLASQLQELLGHDQIVVKPVIDLHDQVSVHSYEIPDRIRERVRLRHPVDMFPYSGAEATVRMDQDHITPYNHTARRDPTTSPPKPTASPDQARPLAPGRGGLPAPPKLRAPSKPPRASTRPPARAGEPVRPPRPDRRDRTGRSDRTGQPNLTGRATMPEQPGQTSVDNLIPQGRLHHRAKTFGGWRNRRLPSGAIEWTSPNGFRFHVDHTGTHHLPRQRPDQGSPDRPSDS